MDQTILAVDEAGNFLEYIPKKKGHTGLGQRHLAITVLLINSQGQVLLQRRKHQIFDNIWDFTGATHPLHKSSFRHCEDPAEPGTKQSSLNSPTKITSPDIHRDRNDNGYDETLEEATQRCLQVEYGITENIPFKNLGFFNYFAQYEELCENEHCAMMVGKYDGEVKMDPGVGYEYKWMDKEEFLKDAEENPQKYAPWAIEGIKVLKQVKFS